MRKAGMASSLRKPSSGPLKLFFATEFEGLVDSSMMLNSILIQFIVFAIKPGVSSRG